MRALIDSLPFWTWRSAGAFHATSILPELAALVGLAALLALTLGANRGHRRAHVATRATLTVLSLLSVAATLLVVNGLTYSEGLDEGLFPFTLAILGSGLAFAALLYLMASRARGLTLAAALLVAPLALASLAHAGALIGLGFGTIDVDGSPHQHVGLSQRVQGTVRGRLDWHMTRDGGFVSGDEEGLYRVDLEAVRGLERVRRVYPVRVGREVGDRRFPLRDGNTWTYRVAEEGSDAMPFERELTVSDRSIDGPLHVVELQGFERTSNVYAIDGALYVRDGEEATPFFGAVEPDARRDFRAMDVSCGSYVAAGGDFGLPGPSRCKRAGVGGLGVAVVAAVTLGLVNLSRRPFEATLVRSKRRASARFEVPVQKPVGLTASAWPAIAP